MKQSRPARRRRLRRLRRGAMRVRARVLARGRAAAAATAPWRSGRWLGTAGRKPWLRRGALLAVLLAVAFVPYPTQSAPALVATAGCRTHCRPAEVNMFRWYAPVPGEWDLDNGLLGTVPANGTGYVAVGDGVVALGVGMSVYAYQASNGKPMWQETLNGFAAGAAIISMRAWPGEVTVGVSYLGQHGASKRTEVVIPDVTGVQGYQYPAASFGGAVAATSAYTVIIGPRDVTSYDNVTGKVRWQRPDGDLAQGWQIDGRYLYLTESGGDSAAPITALRVIDTATGVVRQILPQPVSDGVIGTTTQAFDGTLDGAFDGTVLFSAASGVTAYSGTTGIELWSVPDAVPAGADPEQNRVYLTRGSTLLKVSPATGRIEASAADLGGGMYVVRNGFALGLDLGAQGAAWGYDITAERVALSASGFGWPHYFTDLSGIGGSADPDGSLVVIAACAKAGQPIAATPSGQASSGLSGSPGAGGGPGATVSPAPVVQPCLRPELVALGL